MLKLDIIMSKYSNVMVIYTEFGASLDLQTKKDNCATDNHAVVFMFYVICGWKEAEPDAVDEKC